MKFVKDSNNERSQHNQKSQNGEEGPNGEEVEIVRKVRMMWKVKRWGIQNSEKSQNPLVSEGGAKTYQNP